MKLQECAEALGFALTYTGPELTPVEDDWQGFRFTVTLTRNGKPVLSTPYTLGSGHVKSEFIKAACRTFPGINKRFQSLILKHGWTAKWTDDKGRDEARAVALAAAKLQKLAPTLPDVLHSLVTDGGPHFNNETFEEWADNYGYSTDSIKAKATFDACRDIGAKLARCMTREELDQLTEAASDY